LGLAQPGLDEDVAARHRTHAVDQPAFHRPFGDVATRPGAHGLLDEVGVLVHGQDQYPRAGQLAAQLLRHLNARSARHIDVAKDHVWL